MWCQLPAAGGQTSEKGVRRERRRPYGTCTRRRAKTRHAAHVPAGAARAGSCTARGARYYGPRTSDGAPSGRGSGTSCRRRCACFVCSRPAVVHGSVRRARHVTVRARSVERRSFSMKRPRPALRCSPASRSCRSADSTTCRQRQMFARGLKAAVLLLGVGSVRAAGKNLARGRPAAQSSVCCSGAASRGVDGNADSVFSDKKDLHTHHRVNEPVVARRPWGLCEA